MIEYYVPEWRQRCHELQSAGKRWLRRIKFHAIRLFTLYLAAALCFMLVFGMANYFWFTFRHTPIGAMFLDSHPPEAILAIFTATADNLVPLAFRLSLDTAITCLLLGLACQLFAITRYLYTGRGMLNRLLWFALCAALPNLDFIETWPPFEFTTGMVLYLVPASCLAGVCLEFTSHLLPEIWIVLKLRDLRQFVKVAKIRNGPRQPSRQ